MDEKPKQDEVLDPEMDIVIDPDRLDYEWTRHAATAHKWGQILADAILDRDRKKDELAQRKAELDLDVRENWTEYGLTAGRGGAPTETLIANTVLLNEDIQRLTTDLNDLNYEVTRLFNIRSDFEHRKSALEYLSRLYLGGYFGEPKISTQAKDSYTEIKAEQGQIQNLESSERLMRRRKENG